MAKAFVFILVLILGQPQAAQAFERPHAVEMADDTGQYPIRPSEAAMIAKDANPDATVLNVKLLPSGVYAVTLKIGGSVSRVMVDATSGSIS
jgi:hypothetical protein